jgi:hypothetical protein
MGRLSSHWGLAEPEWSTASAKRCGQRASAWDGVYPADHAEAIQTNAVTQYELQARRAECPRAYRGLCTGLWRNLRGCGAHHPRCTKDFCDLFEKHGGDEGRGIFAYPSLSNSFPTSILGLFPLKRWKNLRE